MAGFDDVRRLPRRVRGPAPTAASTRSRTPARRAGRACALIGDAACPAARDAVAGGRGAAARRRDRRRQGPRRLPPRLPRRRRGRRRALRARKHREDKPFALMARRPRGGARARRARRRRARRCSRRPARPIVLAPRRAGRAASRAAVAPASRELGVMLPYSPLHHLLLADAGGAARADQRQRLRRADRLPRRGRAASGWPPSPTRSSSTTARSTCAPTTPSCASCAGAPAGAAPLARATCPRACALPVAGARAGARLRRRAEEHVLRGARARARGSATTSATCSNARDAARRSATGIAHFERLFAVAPEVVAHDLHPDYLSTAYALEREGVELVGVQHHHAHLAACLAEHGETGPAVGAIFDGTGLRHRRHGLGRRDARRRPARRSSAPGTCWPVRLPGGDRAVREPWRMACAWLVAAAGARRRSAGARAAIGAERWRAVARLAATRLRGAGDDERRAACSTPSPRCAGCARAVTYEGQAAIELEAARRPGRARRLRAAGAARTLVLDARATIRAVVDDLARGRRAGAVVAARFHRAAGARRRREACARAAPRRGLDARRALRRRVPEPAAARAHGRRLRARGPARARPAARCRRTTAASPTARRRSPRARRRG